MKINLIKIFSLAACVLIAQGCKDDLGTITNENSPPVEVALASEAGILAFAKGGVFFNALSSGTSAAYFSSLDDGLGEGMLLIVYAMHESMGDVIFVPWGNNNFKFADNPTDFKLDDNTNVVMPIGVSQPFEMKLRNNRAYGATNAFLPEWTYMYTLNNAANVLLSKVDGTTFSGDAATKRAVLKAWAYWWKGYAYSRLGSMYIAGTVTDEPYNSNGDFKTNLELVAEGNANFDKAVTILNGLTVNADYTATLATILPGVSQAGSDFVKAGVPTPTEWIHNINTMKARNLIANKRVKDMTPTDWQQVITLTNEGIGAGEFAFVARSFSDDTKSVIGKDDGHPGLYAAIGGSDGSGTFFVSERLIQDFRAGDQRMANNFGLMASPIINKRGRGLGFGTRYYLLDGGNNMNGVYTYTHSSQTGIGADDIYIAGSHEENDLMKAEALMHTGDISGGLGIIDAIRAAQGAGLAAIAGDATYNTDLNKSLEEIRSERRVSLFLRGVSFYDARRNGVIDDKSKGGGRPKSVVLSADASGIMVVNTNAVINYNYLSYFDVPQNDLEFNPAKGGSAPVTSPE
jgi:hypothetical protein